MSKLEFIISIGNPKQIASSPPATDGELIIVGRSNVGKSSLINFLAGKTVARTSRTPGRTRLINLFKWNDGQFVVDLPGYGYSTGANSERLGWAPLIESYVNARESVRGALLLMDSRHFPMPSDLDAAEWLETINIPYVIVLTKTDKLNQRERAALSKAVKIFMDAHHRAGKHIYTSVTARQGRQQLLDAIELLLAGAEAPAQLL